MSRKIRITGALITLIIFFAGLISVCALSAGNVGEVKSAKVDKIGAATASVAWDKVGSADGYFVYFKMSDDEKFTKIATIKDSSITSFKAEELLSACNYSAYVNAYKTTRKGVVESKNHSVLTFKTNPEKMAIDVESDDIGVMEIEWKANMRVTGYEIQYVPGSDFKKAETLYIKNPDKASAKVKDLKSDKDYSVRVRAYTLNNGEKIYGEWSEISKIAIMQGVDLNHLDPNKPMIAITYDDGPGYNSASDKILDVLEKYGVRATFFMVGKNAADHPDNVKRKIALGCEIGNHTYDHNHYGKNVTANDIKKSSEAIYKAGGAYPTCFRSPGGITTDAIRSECKKEKMALYYWSLDTQDWKSRNADSVYKAVMNNVKDGDIILMHEIYNSTAEATKRIVPELIKRGYQLVTCKELVAVKGGKPPVAGTQYIDAKTIKNKTN